MFIDTKRDTENSPAILPRIARADKSAVQECVELYGNMIWALAKQFTDSAADAEKVVPEIFMDIWRNAKFCDLEISEECVWIAFIARRRLAEYAMKNQPSASSAKAISPSEFREMQRIASIAH